MGRQAFGAAAGNRALILTNMDEIENRFLHRVNFRLLLVLRIF
jgi:hypothetical protein